MAISQQDALLRVTAEINQPDLDWPTKPTHVVFDELTMETDTGWIFYYGIPEEFRVLGRDPEPQDNPPWRVDKASGTLSQDS